MGVIDYEIVLSELDRIRHLPRPWTLPNGSVCLSTLRWMAESVLVAIVAQPAITTEALRLLFLFSISFDNCAQIPIRICSSTNLCD